MTLETGIRGDRTPKNAVEIKNPFASIILKKKKEGINNMNDYSL